MNCKKSFIDKFVSFLSVLRKKKAAEFHSSRAVFCSLFPLPLSSFCLLLFFTQSTCRVLFHGSWKMKKYWFLPFAFHHLCERGRKRGRRKKKPRKIVRMKSISPMENLLSRLNHTRQSFRFNCCYNWWNFMSLGSSTSINNAHNLNQRLVAIATLSTKDKSKNEKSNREMPVE